MRAVAARAGVRDASYAEPPRKGLLREVVPAPSYRLVHGPAVAGAFAALERD